MRYGGAKVMPTLRQVFDFVVMGLIVVGALALSALILIPTGKWAYNAVLTDTSSGYSSSTGATWSQKEVEGPALKEADYRRFEDREERREPGNLIYPCTISCNGGPPVADFGKPVPAQICHRWQRETAPRACAGQGRRRH